jgi:hypothetical protein
MASSAAKWRSYLGANMRRGGKRGTKSSTVSGTQANQVVGGGTNTVAAQNIARSTSQLRRMPGRGAGGGVL